MLKTHTQSWHTRDGHCIPFELCNLIMGFSTTLFQFSEDSVETSKKYQPEVSKIPSGWLRALFQRAHQISKLSWRSHKKTTVPSLLLLYEVAGEYCHQFRESVRQILHLHNKDTEGHSCACTGAMRLLEFDVTTRRISAGICILECLVSHAESFDCTDPAHTTTRILDRIHSTASQLITVGESNEILQTVEKALNVVFSHYMRLLSTYCFQGVVDDPHNELFISKTSTGAAAELRTCRCCLLLVCPVFLQPLSERLLAAGNEAALLQRIATVPSCEPQLSFGSVQDVSWACGQLESGIASMRRRLLAELDTHHKLVSVVCSIADFFFIKSTESVELADLLVSQTATLANVQHFLRSRVAAGGLADVEPVFGPGGAPAPHHVLTFPTIAQALPPHAYVYVAPEPLGTFLGTGVLQPYGMLHALLLQLRHCKAALQAGVFARSARSGGTALCTRVRVLRFRMKMATDALLHYITDGVILSEHRRLLPSLHACETLEDFLATHSTFLADLMDHCFLSTTGRPVYSKLSQLFRLILDLPDVFRMACDGKSIVAASEKAFDEVLDILTIVFTEMLRQKTNTALEWLVGSLSSVLECSPSQLQSSH